MPRVSGMDLTNITRIARRFNLLKIRVEYSHWSRSIEILP